MTDFEINKRVAKLQGFEIAKNQFDRDAVQVRDGNAWYMFEPCDNPVDAWPIILKNQIGMWTHPEYEPLWSARFNKVSGYKNDMPVIEYVVHQHKNPLRAAMIVYLMMKDTDNQQEKK